MKTPRYALAALLVLIAAGGADAAPARYAIRGDAVVVTGTGTGTVETSWSMRGTGTAFGTDGIAMSYDCQFGGSAAGPVGVLSGSCGPIDFGACTYVVGPPVAIAIVCPTGGGAFQIRPNDLSPTTSFAVLGTLATT